MARTAPTLKGSADSVFEHSNPWHIPLKDPPVILDFITLGDFDVKDPWARISGRRRGPDFLLSVLITLPVRQESDP